MINRTFQFSLLVITAVVLLFLSIFASGTLRWIAFSSAAAIVGVMGGLWWGGARDIAEIDRVPNSAGDFADDILSVAVNEMREGVLVLDRDMRVMAMNEAARKLFANVDTSIRARPLTELTRNPAIYDAFLDAVRGSERVGVKVEAYAPDRRVLDLRVRPLRPESRNEISGAVGVFFDITRLERLEVVRQEFLSNVSHELRTPLTSIIALTETLEAGALDDPTSNRRFLSIIQKNAARMSRLIEEILELSAIEAGNVPLRLECVRLQSVVDDIISSFSAAAAGKNITINDQVADYAEVVADPHRLTQMLTNLIDNAIKFNREGGSISIDFRSNDRDCIYVEDTGEGIPSHHLPRLFERFYRVDRARSRELGGTGLGLAIVKHLAKAHGGEVTVESQLGKGSKFAIELPRRDDVRNPASIGTRKTASATTDDA